MAFSSLGVFCGSAVGNDAVFARDAEKLGRLLAEKSVRLVYGAGGDGLMGVIASACLNAGGSVLGLADTELAWMESTPAPVTEKRVFNTLNDRKKAMFDESDAFCVFAGGLGTLDELVSAVVAKQIGQFDKPVVLYNRGGFWNPFKTMIDALADKGFVKEKDKRLFLFADTVGEVFQTIERETAK